MIPEFSAERRLINVSPSVYTGKLQKKPLGILVASSSFLFGSQAKKILQQLGRETKSGTE